MQLHMWLISTFLWYEQMGTTLIYLHQLKPLALEAWQNRYGPGAAQLTGDQVVICGLVSVFKQCECESKDNRIA